ncbi:MAG: hypothetical protein ACKPKO_64770, partial [Candidatus Fonsibacter sp.]
MPDATPSNVEVSPVGNSTMSTAAPGAVGHDVEVTVSEAGGVSNDCRASLGTLGGGARIDQDHELANEPLAGLRLIIH